MVALLAEPLQKDAPHRPRLTLVPPPKPAPYDMARRAWICTVLGSLRGWCVYVDETGCEVHGQGAGLTPGESVVFKVETDGAMISAKASVVTCDHGRAFLRFEDLPLPSWDALATLASGARDT